MSVEDEYNISTLESGVDSLIPTEPLESMRSVSLYPSLANLKSLPASPIDAFSVPSCANNKNLFVVCPVSFNQTNGSAPLDDCFEITN